MTFAKKKKNTKKELSTVLEKDSEVSVDPTNSESQDQKPKFEINLKPVTI